MVPGAVVAVVAPPRPNPNVWVQRFRSEGDEEEEEEEEAAGPRHESKQMRVMEAALAAVLRGCRQVVEGGLMAVHVKG